MPAKMKVELLRYTPEPEIAAATAARLCYSKVGISELRQKMDKAAAEKLLDRVINLGHHSVLEHANFTFGIEGVSRAMTHQLVRHRIASFSQQSQRYVDAENFNYVVPPKIAKDEKLKKRFEEFMGQAKKFYRELLEISPKEDARYVLPNAIDTKIIVTMNTRSLYNFFERRCCERAQWEIRDCARKMLAECKKVAPKIFEKAGEPCISKGVCREGDMSCGKWKRVGARLLNATEPGTGRGSANEN